MMWKVRASKWSGVPALAAMSISVLACGSRGGGLPLASAASGTSQGDAGITGEVRVAPTCPVERPGKVCERPYQATIAIRREPTDTLVARVRSSATGHFGIALAPGRYLVVPQNGHPYPRSSRLLVTVRSHHYTTVVITYDSGIR
jgi:hypothetical protein